MIEAFPFAEVEPIKVEPTFVIEKFVEAPASETEQKEEETEAEETPTDKTIEKDYRFLDEIICSKHGKWEWSSKDVHVCGVCHKYAETHTWNAFLKFFKSYKCTKCQ